MLVLMSSSHFSLSRPWLWLMLNCWVFQGLLWKIQFMLEREGLCNVQVFKSSHHHSRCYVLHFCHALQTWFWHSSMLLKPYIVRYIHSYSLTWLPHICKAYPTFLKIYLQYVYMVYLHPMYLPTYTVYIYRYIYIYLEPKWRLFWLEQVLFRGGWPSKIEVIGVLGDPLTWHTRW